MAGLVGREPELVALRRLVAEARAGRGRAALVLGDAGIGKTSLSEAFAGAASDAGLTVVWGRCSEAEAPPYWPWRQVLRALPGTSSGALSGAEMSPVRDALFARVVEDVETATAQGPAAIVLEDIHWADASSLALLRFMIDALPGFPLALVLTARDDPLELTDPAAVALRDMPPAVLRLPLAGLNLESTDAIVRERCGSDVPRAFVDEVHARTGGNPFFVHEIATLRTLHGDRAGFAVPPGVRQVLGRRLARLSQPTHEILTVASVVGDELHPDFLASITDRTSDEVLALLDEAIQSRLVVRRDAALVFVHALVRETLYETQSNAVRSELHRMVAEAIEAGADPWSGRGDGVHAQLAAHWLRAPGEDARRRAGEHAAAAGRAAMDRMAYEQAARYYRWALDAPAADELAVMLELGEAQVLAGEFTAGRTTLAGAAKVALDAGDGDGVARAVLAMGGGVGGFEVEVGDSAQVRLLEAALDLLPGGDGSRRAAVLGRLSVTLAGPGTGSRRVALAREAATMAERVGDVGVEVAALAAYCDAVAGPDHVDERMVATGRMIELAERTHDPRLTLLARRIRLLALLERGEFALADAEVVAYESVADRLRLPLYLWPVPIWRGMRALMRGDVDAAWRYSEGAEALGRRAESLNAAFMVETLRTAHSLATGRTERLAKSAQWIVDTTGGHLVAACMIASAAADAAPDLSRQMFERIRASGIDGLARDAEWLEAVWAFGESGMRHGDPAMVAAAYDALQPYADLWAIDGIGGACFGVTAHQLGRLAAWLGRRDEAARWLQQALARHRDAGATLQVAFTEWALAELGVAAARPRPATSAVEQGVFRREGKVWHVQWRDATATVADSKGMRDLAALVAAPGREVHVLDLVEVTGGGPARGSEAGTGPMLDQRARSAYRARLQDLEHELLDADGDGDTGRAASLRAERDFVAAELGRALGLGGRDRVTGDRVERARKAVAMRISTALRAIAAVHPSLARHLEVSVSTGRFCAYRPEAGVSWRT